MRKAMASILAVLALFLMASTVARAVTPFEACEFILLSASKAVDARKAGASADAISISVRAENEERRDLGASVPEKFIDKFLRDLFSGEYDQMPSGLEFFDSGGPHARRFQAECIAHF
ncbi:MAG: hypothetical protein OER43_16370 [Gammaproteobacteria bacterium]|nr:hypothetical protein [Gammaproteobacteria bacterium]